MNHDESKSESGDPSYLEVKGSDGISRTLIRISNPNTPLGQWLIKAFKKENGVEESSND